MNRKLSELTVGQLLAYAVVIAIIVCGILALRNWSDEREDDARCRADAVATYGATGYDYSSLC